MPVAMHLSFVIFIVLTLLIVHCQNDEDFVETEDPDSEYCDVAIEVTSADSAIPLYSSYYMNRKTIIIAYGTPLTMSCLSEDAASLVMTENEKRLQTESEDKWTIKWSTNNNDLQDFKFVCTNVKTACKQTVLISVIVSLVVISRNVQFSNDNSHDNYTVQFGSLIEVLCSGPDVARLALEKDGDILHTKNLNETTVQWMSRNEDVKVSQYVCKDVDISRTRSVFVKIVPMIYIQSQNKTLIPNVYDIFTHKHIYTLTYQDSIEIFCTWPRPVKLISPVENNEMVKEQVNEYTVKWSVSHLKIGSAVYGCVDSEDTDLVSNVFLDVYLQIVVRSTNFQRHKNTFVVKYGKPLEIFCSGSDAAQLRISNGGVDIPIQRVNKTTVKSVIRNAEIYDGVICCSIGNAKTFLEVDVLPAAVGFSCVSHDLEYLNCTWKALNNQINFTLFYLENGEYNHVCTKRSTNGRSRFCTWDYNPNIKVFSFWMKSCSDLGCSNDTYDIKQASVMKLSPPSEIQVHNSSSRGVNIQWGPTNRAFGGDSFWSTDGDVLYRVEYWYWGKQPRTVNSSLVFCDPSICGINLKLHCPGQFYEVLIYQKLKESIGEEFWSKPGSVTFYTDIDEQTGEDPTCAWKPQKNKEVMKYFVQELKQAVRDEILKIKKASNALKEKLAIFRTLREQIP